MTDLRQALEEFADTVYNPEIASEVAPLLDESAVFALSTMLRAGGYEREAQLWMACHTGDSAGMYAAQSIGRQSGPVDGPAIVSAVDSWAAAISDAELALEAGCQFTCREIQPWVEILRAAGHDRAADLWAAGHAAGDYEDTDEHHGDYLAGDYRQVLGL